MLLVSGKSNQQMSNFEQLTKLKKINNDIFYWGKKARTVGTKSDICLLDRSTARLQWLADIGGRGDMQIYALLFSFPPHEDKCTAIFFPPPKIYAII